MRNLKKAVVKFVIQTKVNPRKAGVGGKIAMIIEAQYPFRKLWWYRRWVGNESAIDLTW